MRQAPTQTQTQIGKLFTLVEMRNENDCSYQVQHYQMDLNSRSYLDQRRAVLWSLLLLLAVVVHFLGIHTTGNSRPIRPSSLYCLQIQTHERINIDNESLFECVGIRDIYHHIWIFHQRKHHNHIEIQRVDSTSMHNIQQFHHLNPGILHDESKFS